MGESGALKHPPVRLIFCVPVTNRGLIFVSYSAIWDPFEPVHWATSLVSKQEKYSLVPSAVLEVYVFSHSPVRILIPHSPP